MDWHGFSGAAKQRSRSLRHTRQVTSLCLWSSNDSRASLEIFPSRTGRSALHGYFGGSLARTGNSCIAMQMRSCMASTTRNSERWLAENLKLGELTKQFLR